MSKPSLGDIIAKTNFLKYATATKEEIFKPIVFLKTSIKNPITKALINKYLKSNPGYIIMITNPYTIGEK
tara:strand:+ start:302 stop:511 length:210 start_codon:yes stop_codon:yes gene_type:complete